MRMLDCCLLYGLRIILPLFIICIWYLLSHSVLLNPGSDVNSHLLKNQILVYGNTIVNCITSHCEIYMKVQGYTGYNPIGPKINRLQSRRTSSQKFRYLGFLIPDCPKFKIGNNKKKSKIFLRTRYKNAIVFYIKQQCDVNICMY